MRGFGLVVVGLLVPGVARAQDVPARTIFDWVATSVAACDDPNQSRWRGGEADGGAVAAVAMASLAANLSPNPLAAAWTTFPAAPRLSPRPATQIAKAQQPATGSPLVIYGGRPDQADDFPLPPLTTQNSPRGHGLVRVGSGAPIVGGAPAALPDTGSAFGSGSGSPITAMGFALPTFEPPALSLDAFPAAISVSVGRIVPDETPRTPQSPGPIAADTPEPGTFLLAAVGLGVTAVVRRRRRAQSRPE